MVKRRLLHLLQVDMEERFCERVKAMGCTCVTISHRPALVAFHDLILALDGEGGWALHRGAHANPKDGAPELGATFCELQQPSLCLAYAYNDKFAMLRPSVHVTLYRHPEAVLSPS